MLTDQDIDRIMAVMASKQDMQNLDTRLIHVEDTLAHIVTGLDRVASTIERISFENAATDAKVARHELWIDQLATETHTTLTT